VKLHLVIPDAHIKPKTSFERVKLIGKLIDDRGPDRVVCLGDWFDMPSLSSYDKARKSFEGRRFIADVAAGNAAMHSLKRSYSHKLLSSDALEGNHEFRIVRAIELSPELDGTISTGMLDWTKIGYEYHPYKGATPCVISRDGVNYAHFFISGVQGRPISGEHPAHSLLSKQFSSCVAGHSHLRDFAERTTANRRKISGLVAGCFLEHFENYAGEANEIWWSGVVLLHVFPDGSFDPEFISLKRLKDLYGH
jgi:hypothetical protein